MLGQVRAACRSAVHVVVTSRGLKQCVHDARQAPHDMKQVAMVAHAPSSDEAALSIASAYCNLSISGRGPAIAEAVMLRRLSAVPRGAGDLGARPRQQSAAAVAPAPGTGDAQLRSTTTRRRSPATVAADARTVQLGDGRLGVQLEDGVVAVVRRPSDAAERRNSTTISVSASAKRLSVSSAEGGSSAIATQGRRPSANGGAGTGVARK